MNDKEKQLYQFYLECKKKGYVNMEDATESLKAKVIATDMGIKYKNISQTYTEAEKIYQEEIKKEEIRKEKAERERKLQNTDGDFLVKLSSDADSMSIYMREDGSFYWTHGNKTHKHEGVPTINLHKGGIFFSTYHPPKAVYTGASSGGVSMGGVHYTKAYTAESVKGSDKGYIEVAAGDFKLTLQRINLSENVLNRFHRDKWLKNTVKNSNLIYCYDTSQAGSVEYAAKLALKQTDFNLQKTMLTMAMDQERLPMEKCKTIAEFLNKVLSGQFPLLDEEAYEKALSLENGTTAKELGEALSIYRELSGYKDSNKRKKDLQPRYDDLLQYEKEQAILKKEEEEKRRAAKNKKRTIWFGLCFLLFVIGIGAKPYIEKYIQTMKNYNEAVQLFEEGKYEGAMNAFEELGDYKDSQERAIESAYQRAFGLIEEGEYYDAANSFKSLGEYKDAKERAIESIEVWIADILEEKDSEDFYLSEDNHEKLCELVNGLGLEEILAEDMNMISDAILQSKIRYAIEWKRIETLEELINDNNSNTMSGKAIKKIILGRWNMIYSTVSQRTFSFEFTEDGSMLAIDYGVYDDEYSLKGDVITVIGCRYKMYDLGKGYYLLKTIDRDETISILMWK